MVYKPKTLLIFAILIVMVVPKGNFIILSVSGIELCVYFIEMNNWQFILIFSICNKMLGM